VTLLLAGLAVAGSLTAGVAWEPWTDQVFAKARAEKRLVLLDVGAEWCHWCHVMDDTTYREPVVLRLLSEKYVPVRVDADAQPDLANRYEDYGWPATIVFDASGRELVKFKGYIAPERMRSMLEGVLEDPEPGPSVQAANEKDVPDTAPATVSDELRAELLALHAQRYDDEHGGWGFVHKYLDGDAVELSLLRASEADSKRAKETLDKAAKHLIDPVWGGLYQYSDGGVWENPHFEKIASFQSDGLRAYSLAFARWHDPAHLKAAQDIVRYLRAFLLTPQGAFRPSQDADVVPGQHSAEYFALDDAARRKQGVPRVDPHLYTRENAWIVSALLAYHAASGDDSARADALAAARFIVEQRGLDGGGYRHDENDPGGPYLGDTAAAGLAFMDLYRATGDAAWLRRAEAAAGFVDRAFRVPGLAGFVTAKPSHAFDRPRPQRDENVTVARFGAALARATGDARGLDLARHALRYLAAPEIARQFATASVLLAEQDVTEAAAAERTKAAAADRTAAR
jgi:uncharacterized protein YyaL (SSP411 family)